jgi:hypothetical protein
MTTRMAHAPPIPAPRTLVRVNGWRAAGGGRRDCRREAVSARGGPAGSLVDSPPELFTLLGVRPPEAANRTAAAKRGPFSL